MTASSMIALVQVCFMTLIELMVEEQILQAQQTIFAFDKGMDYASVVDDRIKWGSLMIRNATVEEVVVA